MPPSVRLAGYNLDADLIQDVLELMRAFQHGTASKEGHNAEGATGQTGLVGIPNGLIERLSPEAFTPETISAAYARISRDPRHVSDLRKAARHSVARARKSNENIIFGLGHASVAEHACFNFDIAGLSRLASEELQSHRLISFTEKSQRYITISPDHVVPPELAGSKWEKVCASVAAALFASYERLTADLMTSLTARGDFADDTERERRIEHIAKEDCRYVLPLCCSTQMGVTMNARNVEHVVSELSDHPLEELRQLGREIARAVSGLAPSLVKYLSRGRYPRRNRAEIAAQLPPLTVRVEPSPLNRPATSLIEHTPQAEERVLEALLFSLGKAQSREPSDRRQLWLKIFEGMSEHDAAPREFEIATMTFESVVSASCFAQLKRHRMMTLLAAPYETISSVMLPPTIRDAALDSLFVTAVQTASEQARALSREHPVLAPYLLTNAHCRRVLMHVNARELYHFAHLRCDAHAQWEIRMLADDMLEQARKLWPDMMMLACGKDRFAEEYRRHFPPP